MLAFIDYNKDNNRFVYRNIIYSIPLNQVDKKGFYE